MLVCLTLFYLFTIPIAHWDQLLVSDSGLNFHLGDKEFSFLDLWLLLLTYFSLKSVFRIFSTQAESNIKKQYWFNPKVQKSQRVISISQTSQTSKFGDILIGSLIFIFYYFRKLLTHFCLCASKACGWKKEKVRDVKIKSLNLKIVVFNLLGYYWAIRFWETW